MNRTWLAATLLVGLLWASGAEARVEDPFGLLGDGVAAAVDDQLGRMNAGSIDVLVVPSAPEGLQAAADVALAARPRTRALVLFAARDQAVAVALGPGLREAGVTPERVARWIRQSMPEALASGVPSEGLIALVQELKLAEATRTPAGHIPPPPPARWPLAVGAALGLGGGLGGLALAVRRRRARLRAAWEVRTQSERGRLAKLREDLAALRGHLEARPDPLRREGLATLAALEAEQAELRQALRALAEALAAGERRGVEARLETEARRGVMLQLGLGALVAVLSSPGGEPPGLAPSLVRRWEALASAVGRDAEPVQRLARMLLEPTPALAPYFELLEAQERLVALRRE